MSTLQAGVFITISIICYLTSTTYCHPNELGIHRHQSQQLSRLLKRETLTDVYHSLEAFENSEESLPGSFQKPLKRSVLCKSKGSAKEPEGDKTTDKKDTKPEDGSSFILASSSREPVVDLQPQVLTTPNTNKSCVLEVFRDTDNFFQNVNHNLQLLSNELTKIFNDIANKTSSLLGVSQIMNTDFLDTTKCKSTKNFDNLSASIAELKKNFSKIFEKSTPMTAGLLSSLRDSSSATTKISTCVGNIENNVTEFTRRMKEKFGGVSNNFNDFLDQLKNAVNPLKTYNFTILDKLRDKFNITSMVGNKTALIQQLTKEYSALGVLGDFLNQFMRGINGFYQLISKKWSQENRHSHHHGLGLIKHAFGWPSHAQPEPNFFHKIFSLPNFHSKHHNEHVPLLKKILKIPNHHHHRHHPGIIEHLLNSLYSVFHLTDHCECPQGSNSGSSCPVSQFFNWLGKPTSHHQHQHTPSHINFHHKGMMHKQPACSCS